MANFGLADRRFARASAVEKIAHVVFAGVENDLLLLERLADNLVAAGLDVFSVHENPTVGAGEFHAITLLALNSATGRSVGVGAGTGVSHAIRINVVDLVIGGSGVASGSGLGESLALD